MVDTFRVAHVKSIGLSLGNLVLLPALVLAGPNAGGVLFLDADTTAVADSSYCGAVPLAACSLSVVTLPMWNPTTTAFHVWAVFPPASSPRLMGLTFGISYDPAKFVLSSWGKCGDFELAGPGWPGSGSGTSMLWNTAQTSNMVEAYWFQGYAYSYTAGDSTSLALVPHPDQGGYFADDGKPSALDPIAAYGAIGFGTVGKLPCPVDQGGQNGVNWIHQSEPNDDQPPDSLDAGGEAPTGGAPPEPTPTNQVSVYLDPQAITFDPNETQPVPIGSVTFNDANLRQSIEGTGATTIQKAFPGMTLADTVGFDTDGHRVLLADISCYYHLAYPTVPDAQSAIEPLLRTRGVGIASLLSNAPGFVQAPNDSFYIAYCNYDSSASWNLRNDDLRTNPYCGDAVRHCDIGAEEAWSYAQGYGDSTVVIGEVDTGIYGGMQYVSGHPDLRVIPLSYSDRQKIQVHPSADWCYPHGTEMAGLEAALTNNLRGVAGVCGNCSLLDIEVSDQLCECPANPPDPGCANIDPTLWYARVSNSLGLGLTGKTLRVLNFPFDVLGDPPTEVTDVLARAYQSNIALVASSVDSSYTTAQRFYPALIPFVVGTGGINYRGDLWGYHSSCYRFNSGPGRHSRHGGTAVGPTDQPSDSLRGMVQICAPASPVMMTTVAQKALCIVGKDTTSYWYGTTTGQCSGASAQVAGSIALLQSIAHQRADTLTNDDAVGLLTGTARGFASDPRQADSLCTTCPRSWYGKGTLDVGAAASFLRAGSTFPGACAYKGDPHGRNWSYVRVDSFVVADTTWIEFRASEEIQNPEPGYPIWSVRRQGTNTRPSYSADYPSRLHQARARGFVPDCYIGPFSLSGWATIFGFDYAFRNPQTGRLVYLVGENNVRMCYNSGMAAVDRVGPRSSGQDCAGDPAVRKPRYSASQGCPVGAGTDGRRRSDPGRGGARSAGERQISLDAGPPDLRLGWPG